MINRKLSKLSGKIPYLPISSKITPIHPILSKNNTNDLYTIIHNYILMHAKDTILHIQQRIIIKTHVKFQLFGEQVESEKTH